MKEKEKTKETEKEKELEEEELPSDFAAMSDVDAEGEIDDGELAQTSNVEVERVVVEKDLENVDENVELEREEVVEREVEVEREESIEREEIIEREEVVEEVDEEVEGEKTPIIIDLEVDEEGEEKKEKGKGKEKEIEKEEEEPRSDHSWTEGMIVDLEQLPSSKALLQMRNRLARTQNGVKTAVRTLLGMVTRVENYKEGVRIVKNLEDFVKYQLDVVEEIAKEYLEGDL